ncbi:MAG: UDP-N-acetylglucosamine 1-carboxyvinyltransferase [Elusimicrobia bacterium CG08_land_8_20_14_0_20_51_18]|nr:MAG: UDP-N-acetylglucosamine 1-carboxyvinyltransferase [Elusimicrobia bacterium CG08_land_8_20_14_0_20_51_18]
MDSFTIKGGSKIQGEVRVSGSKNSSLPVLFSTVLTSEKCVIKNVPDLMDIKSTFDMLSYAGKNCFFGFNLFSAGEGKKLKTEAPYELVRKMRASVLIAGPLLARFHHVKFALPGGCAIGVRPIDIHLEGFKKMGAKISYEEGNVILKADRLKGARIKLAFPSVGATENLMMAAALIDDLTEIRNAAREPEISDLAGALRKMGAEIEGDGTPVLKVRGKTRLRGFEHSVIPDRIEAGTFLILCAALGGSLKVTEIVPEHLKVLIKKLKESGAQLYVGRDYVEIKAPARIKSVNISTGPYPAFPTDLQAQWMAYMTLASGTSRIQENIFENRFMHAAELMRMGADIKIKRNCAFIKGVKGLSGATVMASDLRAGAALLLAGAAASGKTRIRRVYHIDRGYDRIEEKMRCAGVKMERAKE